MKYSHLATTYMVYVDGLDFGMIEYPFKVHLSVPTLNSIREELGRRYHFHPQGVTFMRVDKSPRRQKHIVGKAIAVEHRGTVQ